MSQETRTKTVVKCDHCHKAKAEGLRLRITDLCEWGETEKPGYLDAKPTLIARFEGDLCNACLDGLIDTMQNYLRVKANKGK